MAEENFRAGFVALIGRPNAGKSTLLNKLVGEKIAAVSNKPQTTRHKIQGVVTRPDGQIVFVDTPGVHKPGYLLNRRMMAAVNDAILSPTEIKSAYRRLARKLHGTFPATIQRRFPFRTLSPGSSAPSPTHWMSSSSDAS